MTQLHLSLIVHIVAGHTLGREEVREPEWTGTLEAFWSNNDGVTWGEVRDLITDGRLPIGGGAQGCFTVLTEDTRGRLLAEWDARATEGAEVLDDICAGRY